MGTKNMILAGLIASICLIILSCSNKIKKHPFQESLSGNTLAVADTLAFRKTIDGKSTALYFLHNTHLKVAITNYGARIVSLQVPDKLDNYRDIVVGYDSLLPYTRGSDTYFGAVVGRYGNRIARGRFILEGKKYQLAINNPPNHLHGGTIGFSRRVWDVTEYSDSSLTLRYFSKNMEEGYPGDLTVIVKYTATHTGSLKLEYQVSSDKATVANITNHTYFNLNGEGSGSVGGHLLMIRADYITPIDSTFIPTGDLLAVKGTPFDFLKPRMIGLEETDTSDLQLKNGHGYDHNFVLSTGGSLLNKAAEVVGDKSGIVMDIYTTEPGIQFYGGNFMDGTHQISSGGTDEYRTAFCLETQHFPDSPNHPAFPSTTLAPGKVYRSTTVYSFGLNRK